MQELSIIRICIDLNDLLSSPRIWEKVSYFYFNDHDEIRRVNLQRDSCRPLGHNFPKKWISGVLCQFNPN